MEQNYYPNQGVAAVLSFLFTGLGQIYNGQIKKGLFLMSVSTVSLIACIIGAIIVGWWLYNPMALSISMLFIGLALFILSILIIACVGVYNIYDAYNTARALSETA